MIGIRFDIDTHYGLVERTPQLLDLLSEFGITASFFCVMGDEANALDIATLRFLKRGVSKTKIDASRKGGLAYLVRAALLPRAVGHGNPERLCEIVRRGHELQPHGWKHIQWQRNIDRIDVRDHLRRAVLAYRSTFGADPVGFASPGRVYNEAALAAFDELGIRYVGDMDGDRPFRPTGHAHVQIPVTYFKTIAEMRAEGMDDGAIGEYFIAEIQRRPDFCTFYEHPDNLFDAEFAILRRIYGYIRERNLETVTHSEILRRFLAAERTSG